MRRSFVKTCFPIVPGFLALWLVVQWTSLSIEARGHEQPNPSDSKFIGLDVQTITNFGGRVAGTVRSQEISGESFVFLGSEAMIVLPAERFLTPEQGSISFTVIATWPGNDQRAHTFVHMAIGPCHVTIFKTDTNTLRFTYRGREEVHAACDLDITDWQPNEPHEISAGWCKGYGDLLWIVLRVDGREALTHRAVPLVTLPEELFIGRRGPSAQPAEAWIGKLQIRPVAPVLPFAAGPKPPVMAEVDCSVTQPFRRVHDFTTIWNSQENPVPFGVGSPEFRLFQQGGFRMARLVAFSEGWLWGTRVTRDETGRLVTDFSDFDRLLSVITAAGAEPYIRLAYHTPSALVSPSTLAEHRRYALPENLELWDELMERIVRHVLFEQKLPVRYWVTALNEGDLPVARGQAEPETIYQLYERTSRIVKRLDPQAKVGGPALARSIDLEGRPMPMFVDFLRYCRDRDVPLDFVCFHGYGFAHPRQYEGLVAGVRSAVQTVWPEKAPSVELFLDEWNLWSRTGEQDNEYGAAYLAAALHYQRRSGLTKSSIVSFNHFLRTQAEEATLFEKVGPFARTADSPVCFQPGTYTCAGRSLPGVRLHPPNGQDRYTFCRVEVQVPSEGNPRLEAAVGVVELPTLSDGCGFQVVALSGDKLTHLMETFQRPGPWKEIRVPLGPFAGQRINLEFRTDPGPKGQSTADWAVWADPRIVVESDHGEKVIWRLMDHLETTVSGARRAGRPFVYNDQTIALYSGLPLIKGQVVTTPYFVWAMHHRLAHGELRVNLPGRNGILDDDTGGLTATADENRIVLLLWHFDVMQDSPRSWQIRLKKMPPAMSQAKQFRCTEYRIDREHNNPYTRYVRRGEDSQGGAYNLETASLEVTSKSLVRTDAGTASLEVVLPNMAVSLIEICPE